MSEKPTYEELKRRVRQLEKQQAERELVEKRLVAKIRRFEDVVDAANVGTWEWNVRTGALLTNERWARILGFGLEEIFPVTVETWRSHIHPEDLEKNLLALQAHFHGSLDHYEGNAGLGTRMVPGCGCLSGERLRNGPKAGNRCGCTGPVRTSRSGDGRRRSSKRAKSF